MIEWERRMKLRHYLEQGLTQTQVAAKLGISRRTIYRWIRRGELDRDVAEVPSYGPRPLTQRKLDPYKPIILERLAEFPKLSAVRLFDEVKKAGYPGGYTQLKQYVRTVRPRPPEDPVVRFETPPGKQAQVDLAHFKLPWGRRYALVVVLGYSRLLWLRFYRRQDMRTLFGGLEAAFASFGGVPGEILFDQMRSVITKDLRSEGGPLIENAEFLRFAHHWGFRPRACRPYRAKTKGKVERPIRYVRENFFYGRSFGSDDELNDQVADWLNGTANVREHGTLKERPIDRFRRERGALLPLAPRPYRSLVLPHRAQRKRSGTTRVPHVDVERRPLEAYARVSGGGR